MSILLTCMKSLNSFLCMVSIVEQNLYLFSSMFGLLHWPIFAISTFLNCFSYSGFLAYFWIPIISPICCLGLLLLSFLQNVISPELPDITPRFSQVSIPVSSVLLYTVSKAIAWHTNISSPHFLSYFVLLSLALCYVLYFSLLVLLLLSSPPQGQNFYLF